jgi:hypothetical protein
MISSFVHMSGDYQMYANPALPLLLNRCPYLVYPAGRDASSFAFRRLAGSECPNVPQMHIVLAGVIKESGLANDHARCLLA